MTFDTSEAMEGETMLLKGLRTEEKLVALVTVAMLRRLLVPLKCFQALEDLIAASTSEVMESEAMILKSLQMDEASFALMTEAMLLRLLMLLQST